MVGRSDYWMAEQSNSSFFEISLIGYGPQEFFYPNLSTLITSK